MLVSTQPEALGLGLAGVAEGADILLGVGGWCVGVCGAVSGILIAGGDADSLSALAARNGRSV